MRLGHGQRLEFEFMNQRGFDYNVTAMFYETGVVASLAFQYGISERQTMKGPLEVNYAAELAKLLSEPGVEEEVD